MNHIIALFRPHVRMERCITAYVDGELPPREIARFEAHLPACEACSRAVAEERVLKSMLSTSLPNVPAPRSFHLTEAMIARPAAIGGAVPRRHVQGQALVFARISQFGAAAAGLALLSVVVLDFNSGSDSTTADPLIEAAGDTSIADGDAADGDDAGVEGQAPPEGPPAIPTPDGGVTGSSASPTPADADTGL
ncbi:MAG: zf-HC2 domain-containing protein [Dehalococcoidia bacterium]